MKDGMDCLLGKLGTLETEIFISTILREPFDYTEWQRDHFADVTLDDFLEKAVRYDEAHPFTKVFG
jgi:hypothetical protein